MGLAVSNIRLLSLTARKADCEYNISIDSMKKMALTREQSDLSKEYYARLKAKTISYYANGQYNMMDYSYLMGNGMVTAANIINRETGNMKKDSSMVLTDRNGLVVMNDLYADILKSVLGASCIDAQGRGSTFSIDKIPELISEVAGGYCSKEDVEEIIQDGKLSSNYNVTKINSRSGDTISTGNSHDNSDRVTSKIEALVNYFYPIFQAAAMNGWTTEYNKEMNNNQSYISDSLVSGIFQLEQVDSAGDYKPDASLSYFTTSGLVLERNDSKVREEVTAWYNAEKEAISEKEGWIDLELQDLSTELEAINTEIESVKSLIQDSMNIFNWCNG